MNLIMMAVAAL